MLNYWTQANQEPMDVIAQKPKRVIFSINTELTMYLGCINCK